VEILEEIGEWMKVNGESIYGCGPSEYPKPEWGCFTQKEDVVYAHMMNYNVGQYCLPHMRGKVQEATLLLDGTQLRTGEISNVNTNSPYVAEDDLFINLRRRRRPSPPVEVQGQNTPSPTPIAPTQSLNAKYRVVKLKLTE